MATATGKFYPLNGRVIGPDGLDFVGRGVNVYNLNSAVTNDACEPLTKHFPNIGMIRLDTQSHSYPSVASMKTAVDRLLKLNVVVAIEDHLFPQSAPVGGTSQTAQSAWYASWANAYKGDPFFQFMTTNEPTGTVGQVMDNHQAIYKAIRDTGNTSMIWMCTYAGGGPNRQGTAGGFDPARYKAMSNVGFDEHVYSWYFGGSTMDQNKIDQTVKQYIADCQAFNCAEGPMPVVIGEYGDSTDGNNIDQNWVQVLASVHKSGFGSQAWNYDKLTPNPGDTLVNNGQLTVYGKNVAAHVLAGKKAGRSGGVVIPPRPESVEGTHIGKASDPAIINRANEAFTMTTDGKVAVDGVTDQTTSNVTAQDYVSRRVVQTNTAGNFYSKSVAADAWVQDATGPTPPIVIPPTGGITHLTVQAKIDALKASLASNATTVNAALTSIRTDLDALTP